MNSKDATPLSPPSPEAHDAPGLSPFERMAELTRRLFSVPPKELAREKQREAKRKDH